MVHFYFSIYISIILEFSMLWKSGRYLTLTVQKTHQKARFKNSEPMKREKPQIIGSVFCSDLICGFVQQIYFHCHKRNNNSYYHKIQYHVLTYLISDFLKLIRPKTINTTATIRETDKLCSIVSGISV